MSSPPKHSYWVPGTDHQSPSAVKDMDHAHVINSKNPPSKWEPMGDNRDDQEMMAQEYMGVIRSTTETLYQQGWLKEDKWTNDPQVFPMTEHELPLSRRKGVSGLVAFPPNDQQYYIVGQYDRRNSLLTESSKPGHNPYTDAKGTSNSTWTRLCDFSEHDGIVHLFRERGQKGYHYGRVMQGALDNGYFVEALNAVTLRPKLVRHLFHCYDLAKSIYIVRLFKHGWWWRMELDDYVPVSPPPTKHHQNKGPICCVSEHFPMVMWPSLVEKAYAKLCTHRDDPNNLGGSPNDLGGWEAIGGGGRVEDALVLLTGGVAGRFRTREVSADRLFIYLYERQRDTLFVCRVNQPSCELYNVRLNPYYSYSVNRAMPWEGRLYVQVFCGAPICYDGGLQDIAVPYSLVHAEEFPENQNEGFFWCDVNDFHLYFDTIFECHLVNTPDCAIPGMPPPSIPLPMPFPGMSGQQQQLPPGVLLPEGASAWLTGSGNSPRGAAAIMPPGSPRQAPGSPRQASGSPRAGAMVPVAPGSPRNQGGLIGLEPAKPGLSPRSLATVRFEAVPPWAGEGVPVRRGAKRGVISSTGQPGRWKVTWQDNGTSDLIVSWREIIKADMIPPTVPGGSWYAQTLVTTGKVDKFTRPEFTITVPGIPENSHGHGCEILCSLDQFDNRFFMSDCLLQKPAEIRLKAWVVVNDTVVGSRQRELYAFVCKSNWLPVNHSMVGLHCKRGCKIKIAVEFPDGETVNTLRGIFRCYSTVANIGLTYSGHQRHDIGEPPLGDKPAAVKWTMNGCVDESLMENPEVPTEFDPETDGLRKADQDLNKSWQELKQDCSLM